MLLGCFYANFKNPILLTNFKQLITKYNNIKIQLAHAKIITVDYIDN
uniref:Uncharacterized protein n=1 Tax=Rhizophora mucronata TaxID=61149 RepID=A0A2P2IT00_RHIMU